MIGNMNGLWNFNRINIRYCLVSLLGDDRLIDNLRKWFKGKED